MVVAASKQNILKSMNSIDEEKEDDLEEENPFSVLD